MRDYVGLVVMFLRFIMLLVVMAFDLKFGSFGIVQRGDIVVVL